MITLQHPIPLTEVQAANWEWRKLLSTSIIIIAMVTVLVLGTLLQHTHQHYLFAQTRTDMLMNVVDHAPTATIITDEDGQILVWNNGAKALFGWDEGEVAGSSTSFLIPCTSLRTEHQQIWSDPQLRDRILNGEVVELKADALCKDGGTVRVRGTVTGIQNNYRSFILHFYPDARIIDHGRHVAQDFNPTTPSPKRLMKRVQ